jgi:SAM-dependent methyltransferase
MTTHPEIPSCTCYFETQHAMHLHPAMRVLEREVLGCDFGGTSWTTKAQADEIPAALGLHRGAHLLEIGAGSGWPGIYLAQKTGCDITLLDLPVNTLRDAQQRAIEENLRSQFQAVAASGAALPFASASFEAIGHSDVLCCLPEKLSMLKECRRVARPGARMLFYVIAPARHISGPELDEACEVGPPFVGVPDNYENLLDRSGWNIINRTGLTGEYLSAMRRLVECMETTSKTLQEVLGPEEFHNQLSHRQQQISVIERGLLEREMFLVTRAGNVG